MNALLPGQGNPALPIVSQVLGWAYTVVWMVSFYPQIVLNFRRRSVIGFSFDYLVYNTIGYVCYSLFNCLLFWDPELQREYRQAHGPAAVIPVQINDIAFALHGVACVLIQIVQVAVFERGAQRVSKACFVLMSLTFAAIITVIILRLTSVVNWLWVVTFLGYIKAAMSFIKYAPQAFMNCRRRSTVGWSVWAVLCDISGSLLSFSQMFVDAVYNGSFDNFTGDVPKLGLALESFAFDVLFIMQHYCFFNRRCGRRCACFGRAPLAITPAAPPKDDAAAVDAGAAAEVVVLAHDAAAPPALDDRTPLLS